MIIEAQAPIASASPPKSLLDRIMIDLMDIEYPQENISLAESHSQLDGGVDPASMVLPTDPVIPTEERRSGETEVTNKLILVRFRTSIWFTVPDPRPRHLHEWLGN
jgi:hypothetical protein